MPTDPIPRIEAELKRRLIAAAVLLQAEHKRDLSKTYPPASKPGEYPHARTFNLRDAVAVVPMGDRIRVGYLPTVGAYLPVLAGWGRLTVKDTAVRIYPRLVRIVRGG